MECPSRASKAAICGPDIASGIPDPVVELNVHRTRITTLRSTLQACPEPALAGRLDERKRPSDGKDFGVISCSPSSFSKVLDVLRMRKRERYHLFFGTSIGLVTVPANDRVSFAEFVDMYLPGCDSLSHPDGHE